MTGTAQVLNHAVTLQIRNFLNTYAEDEATDFDVGRESVEFDSAGLQYCQIIQVVNVFR